MPLKNNLRNDTMRVFHVVVSITCFVQSLLMFTPHTLTQWNNKHFSCMEIIEEFMLKMSNVSLYWIPLQIFRCHCSSYDFTYGCIVVNCLKLISPYKNSAMGLVQKK